MPQPVRSQISCLSVKPHTRRSRFQRRKLLSQQRRDHTRQQISAAAHGHPGIPRGVYVMDSTVGYAGFVSFQHHDAVQLPRKGGGCCQPVRTGISAETEKFPCVGG